MAPRLVAPVPAVAAGGGGFSVTALGPNQGGFSLLPRDGEPGGFGAPLSGSLSAIAIRAHEYGHLALGAVGATASQRPPELHDIWWQASLDVVVNAFMLARCCVEIAELPLTPPNVELPKLPRYLAATLWIRAEGLSCADEIRSRLVKAERLERLDVLRLAYYARLLGDIGRAWDAGSVAASAERIALRLQRRFGPNWGDDVAALSDLLESISRVPVTTGTPAPLWAPLEVLDLTTPHLRCRPRSRRATRTFVGPLRHAHRASFVWSDGRAWALKKRNNGNGASVLIDCSGSMDLALDTVTRIVARLPAVSIAAYGSLPNDLSRGRLLLLASPGRIVGPEIGDSEMLGVGNVVDGPALQWLASQAQPRFWVSDGIVTGIDDVESALLAQEANGVCQAAGIRRVASVEACIAQIASATCGNRREVSSK